MKSLVDKKDPNLGEKVKAIKEFGTVSKSSLETNAKNTKEYYDTLQEIVKSNKDTSKEFMEFAKIEMEAYNTALKNPISEEERKKIYEDMKSLNEQVYARAEEELRENSDVKEKATSEAKANKEFNWNVLKAFGTGVLLTLGVVVGVKEAPNIINKLIDKK